MASVNVGSTPRICIGNGIHANPTKPIMTCKNPMKRSALLWPASINTSNQNAIISKMTRDVNRIISSEKEKNSPVIESFFGIKRKAQRRNTKAPKISWKTSKSKERSREIASSYQQAYPVPRK